MKITKDIEKQMNQLLDEKKIKSVFQPIVSLKNGKIFGYEALSRITIKDSCFSIGEAFEIAEEMNCLWSLEHLCRVNSLKMSQNKPQEAKLFINVDPNIMQDPEFKSGVTCESLKKYNLNCDDIIFEATERSAIKNMEIFKSSINHYRKQGFRVAVDDVGSGYSGISRVFDVNPQYIKIDMSIIQGIENDELKRSFVSALSQFSKEAGIKLVAEGIETAEQLNAVIALKVDYGQGFYLKKPSENFENTSQSLCKEISELYHIIKRKQAVKSQFRQFRCSNTY